MTAERDSGYILAGTAMIMACLALLATALVATAMDERHRVVRLEGQAVDRMVLRSAVILSASELALPPSRRNMLLEDGRGLSVDGRHLSIRILREGEKTNLNVAQTDQIRERARSAGVSQADVSALIRTVEARRARGEMASIVEEALPADLRDRPCLYEIFTVFSGQDSPATLPAGTEYLGQRLVPGSRVALTVGLENGSAATAIVLMTGEPMRPARIMDWRWHSLDDDEEPGGECE